MNDYLNQPHSAFLHVLKLLQNDTKYCIYCKILILSTWRFEDRVNCMSVLFGKILWFGFQKHFFSSCFCSCSLGWALGTFRSMVWPVIFGWWIVLLVAIICYESEIVFFPKMLFYKGSLRDLRIQLYTSQEFVINE